MHRVILAAMISALAAPAQAGFFTGNELLDSCNRNDSSFVSGYVVGVYDHIEMNRSEGQKRFICIPTGAQARQVRDIVCGFLVRHPENRQWSAAALINNALIEAWPCPKP